MVDSGTVKAAATEINGLLSNYKSTVTGVEGVWKGPSHDSIIPQTDSFASEYQAIEAQLSSFANACDLYKKYETLKTQIADTQAKLNAASDENKSGYQRDLSLMTKDLETIKNSILSSLSSASSPTLQATPVNSSVSAPASSSSASSSNKAFIDSIMGEEGKTISDYPDRGFHDGLWCADFVSAMLIDHGYDIPMCSVAGDGDEDYDIFHALRNKGAVVHLDTGAYNMGYGDSSEYDPNYSPQPGDVVLFNWDGDWSTDHVGFVVQDNGDGTITTLEGNTSGDAGGSCVAVKNRDRDLIYGYATPVPQAKTVTV